MNIIEAIRSTRTAENASASARALTPINPPPSGWRMDWQRRSLLRGERRLEACRALGWETIPARVVGKLSEDELREIERHENTKRRDLDSYEQSLERLREIEAAGVEIEEEKPAQAGPVSAGGRGRRGGDREAARRTGLSRPEVARTASLGASLVRRDEVVAADEIAEPRGGFYPFEMNRSTARVQPGRLLHAHDTAPRANRIAEVSNDLELELGSDWERPYGIEEGSREADVVHPKGKHALSSSRLDHPDSRERAVPGIARLMGHRVREAGADLLNGDRLLQTADSTQGHRAFPVGFAPSRTDQNHSRARRCRASQVLHQLKATSIGENGTTEDNLCIEITLETLDRISIGGSGADRREERLEDLPKNLEQESGVVDYQDTTRPHHEFSPSTAWRLLYQRQPYCAGGYARSGLPVQLFVAIFVHDEMEGMFTLNNFQTRFRV